MILYNIFVTNQAYLAFEDMLLYAKDFDSNYAIKLRNSILSEIDKLERFPSSGKKLRESYRAKVIDGILLIYLVDDTYESVYVIDIIDPRQHSIAKKYL